MKQKDINEKDIVSLLQSIPEKDFGDVSEKLCLRIRREESFRRRLFFVKVSVAASIAILVGYSALNSNGKVETLPQEVQVNVANNTQIDTMRERRYVELKEFSPTMASYSIIASLKSGVKDEEIEVALKYLTQLQQNNGCFGESQRADIATLNHAMVTYALLELYKTGDYQQLFTPLDGALEYIRSTQGENGSWESSRGKAELANMLYVNILGSAEQLGWSDRYGSFRKGLRMLERSEDFSKIASVKSYNDKMTILDEIISQKLDNVVAGYITLPQISKSLASL